MTSEQAAASASKSPLAAIALKLVGIVAIVSALVDYLILIIPPNLTNTQWQLATTTQLVDRGIVPLVGIALLLTGLWIENSVGRSPRAQTLMADLRFWVCALASFLGLVYLLLTFLHLNAVRLSARTALEQVNAEASQASTELEQRLSTELSQQQSQIGQLLQNEELLSQAIQSGQLPPDIEQFRDNPDGLNQFLQQRADQARQEIQTQIGTRRTEAESRVKAEAWKSGLRVSISSILLAIGYSVVGWSGLKRLLSLTRSS
jgi:ABC-type multidrug transport system fused ATPase/permease subunit